MADLSQKIEITIPLRGSMGTINLELDEVAVDYALSTELAEYLRNFWRRRIAEEIFLSYNNRRLLSPRIFGIIRAWGKKKTRSRISKLAKTIAWEKLTKQQVTWDTCPECGRIDRDGIGKGVACTYCS